VALRRGLNPRTAGYLSAILDPVGAAFLLYWFMVLPGSPIGVLGLALAKAFFFVPLVISLWRLDGLNTLLACLGAILASTYALVWLALLSGRMRAELGPLLYLPAGLAALGAGAWFAVRSHRRLLEENFVTDQFLRSSRRLRMTLEIVQVSVLNLEQFVNDLERVSSTLAIGAHSQAKSVERMASLAERLKTAMAEISARTDESSGTLRHSLEGSGQGGRAVRRMIEEMAAIDQAARKMDSSLELINEISDQTNLLALNASIEASRLSDSGSGGFSVVAGEIRSLAEPSAETAGEIGRLVKQMEKITTAGGESSKAVGRVFAGLDQQLGGYSRFIDALQVAVREQLASIREVSDSLGKIRQVTSDNSLAADRVKQVVGELKREVVKLKGLLQDKLVESPQRAGQGALPVRP
jgi:methyl-accepting chemotaxis protein